MCMIVAWTPRVENVSREVEENGKKGTKAHATTAVWAGFHTTRTFGAGKSKQHHETGWKA